MYRSEQPSAFHQASAAYEEARARFDARGWILEVAPPDEAAAATDLVAFALETRVYLAMVDFAEGEVPKSIEALVVRFERATAYYLTLVETLRSRQLEVASAFELECEPFDLREIIGTPVAAPELATVQAYAAATEKLEANNENIRHALWRVRSDARPMDPREVEGRPFEFIRGELPHSVWISLLTMPVAGCVGLYMRWWAGVASFALSFIVFARQARKPMVRLSFDRSGVTVQEGNVRETISYESLVDVELRGAWSSTSPLVESTIVLRRNDGREQRFAFAETAPGCVERLRVFAVVVRRRVRAARRLVLTDDSGRH